MEKNAVPNPAKFISKNVENPCSGADFISKNVENPRVGANFISESVEPMSRSQFYLRECGTHEP